MMATSAFKSTTKRTSVGADDSSSGASVSSSSTNRALRRTRSLSRFSRRLPEQEREVAEYTRVPKGKFVNTTRGSGFPEISLDDLALEFFSSPTSNEDVRESSAQHREGRSARRGAEVGRWASDTASSRRRERSVSRPRNNTTGGTARGGDGKAIISNNSGLKVVNTGANIRRRRSLSVASYQISDSESDLDHSRALRNHANIKSLDGSNNQNSKSFKAAAFSGQRLRRSLSQKDLSQLHDGYSSHSSALTDDEVKDARMGNYGIEKTIQAVYSQKADHPAEDGRNGLYEAMRKELRHAVEDIRTELEQAVDRKSTTLLAGDCLADNRGKICQALSVIKQNYATELKQSEKRKQDLLAEIVLEEQRGRGLSKIVKEIVSNSKSLATAQKPARTRKRSNDRNRMSKQLVEEAEKYFEDFISNMEDTDISSFDGERSDASSTFRGAAKARDASTCVDPESYQSPAEAHLQPVQMDGVILPWLQWETSNDASLSRKSKRTPVTPKALEWDAEQELTALQDTSSHSISSRGSWSPGLFNVNPISSKEESANKASILGESAGCRQSHFDMDEYLKLQSMEDFLFERYKERHRIHSGGLLLCADVL